MGAAETIPQKLKKKKVCLPILNKKRLPLELGPKRTLSEVVLFTFEQLGNTQKFLFFQGFLHPLSLHMQITLLWDADLFPWCTWLTERQAYSTEVPVELTRKPLPYAMFTQYSLATAVHAVCCLGSETFGVQINSYHRGLTLFVVENWGFVCLQRKQCGAIGAWPEHLRINVLDGVNAIRSGPPGFFFSLITTFSGCWGSENCTFSGVACPPPNTRNKWICQTKFCL